GSFRTLSSEAEGELIEGGADPVVHWHVNSEFVVSAAKVLHERVPGRNRACRGEAFQSAHRAKSGLQPAVIGFHQVVNRYEDLGVAGSAGRSRLVGGSGRLTV